MLNLKLQHFGHLMQRTDSFENTLMLGKIGGGGEGDDRVWDSWMASPTQWVWVWASSGSWWWTGKPGVLRSMGSKRVEHDWATELNCWTHIWIWRYNIQSIIASETQVTRGWFHLRLFHSMSGTRGVMTQMTKDSYSLPSSPLWSGSSSL